MIFWKPHIPANTDLRCMIDTSNESQNNGSLTDKLIYGFIQKNVEIGNPKKKFRFFFHGSFQDFTNCMR